MVESCVSSHRRDPRYSEPSNIKKGDAAACCPDAVPALAVWPVFDVVPVPMVQPLKLGPQQISAVVLACTCKIQPWSNGSCGCLAFQGLARGFRAEFQERHRTTSQMWHKSTAETCEQEGWSGALNSVRQRSTVQRCAVLALRNSSRTHCLFNKSVYLNPLAQPKARK